MGGFLPCYAIAWLYRELMKEAHEKGAPVMRPLFYEFQNDDKV
jgi:alpha-glucosidase (family GH31 glycosyl hydrolase)